MAARNIAKSIGEKLTKSEKKTLRKQVKKAHILHKHSSEIADVSKKPTVHLLVGNGGLMCGVDREQLTRLFTRYGSIDSVVMLPQRSYSFVTYKKVEDAINAMRNINGRRLESLQVPNMTPTAFYLAYLAKAPDDVTVSGHVLPPGLRIYEEFVSEQEEQELLDAVGWEANTEQVQSQDTVQKQLRHRRVQHFGYEFLYGVNNVDKDKPLPGGIPNVYDKVLTFMVTSGAVRSRPDQLTINEYQPGQGIPPHVDTHSAFEDSICSLSLGAKITMDFRHPDGRLVPVLLPRRSLLVMSGESRYHWSHGITPRKFDIISSGLEMPEGGTDESRNSGGGVTTSGVTQYERERRVSLTFRTILHAPCTCQYSKQCDSQGYKEPSAERNTSSLPSTQDEAECLERLHVHEVYENIAEHFSDTRHSPWPRIAEFLRSVPVGSLIADVGCGNGKYLGINEAVFKTGSDRSSSLTTIAKDRGHSVIVCDVLSLPYRSGAFDVCLCIAVLHHLSTTERRLAGLRELVRVIRPGGLALVYVWALEQQLEKVKKTDVREISQGADSTMETNVVAESKTTNQIHEVSDPRECSKPSEDSIKENMPGEGVTSDRKQGEAGHVQVNASRGEFEQQDLFVPWKFRGGPKKNRDTSLNRDVTGHVFHRFYHVFKEGELLNLCHCIENVFVKESYYDRGNWCVIIEKSASG